MSRPGHVPPGQIAERLTLRAPVTEFERGIRVFGIMLTQVMMALVLVVFAINVILYKPTLDLLLFAVALAAGVAPELLLAVISITLSKGAQSGNIFAPQELDLLRKGSGRYITTLFQPKWKAG